MKNSIGLVIVAVVAVGLAIALYTTNKNAGERQTRAEQTIASLSNSWERTQGELQEQKSTNKNLERDLDAEKKKLEETSNKLASTSTALDDTQKTLAATKEEVAKREEKIKELESTNADLDKKAMELSATINSLNDQIAATRQQLATTQSDKAFLEKELQRLLADKAELERQFNDLKIVKAQYAKLKEEFNNGRRLEWLRKGLYASDESKGSQRLMSTGPGAIATTPATTNGKYDLNVEVGTDGKVRVIPGLTNSAPTTPKP